MNWREALAFSCILAVLIVLAYLVLASPAAGLWR